MFPSNKAEEKFKVLIVRTRKGIGIIVTQRKDENRQEVIIVV